MGKYRIECCNCHRLFDSEQLTDKVSYLYGKPITTHRCPYCNNDHIIWLSKTKRTCFKSFYDESKRGQKNEV